MPEELFELKRYDPLELYRLLVGDQWLALAAQKALRFPNNYAFTKCVAEHLLAQDKSTPFPAATAAALAAASSCPSAPC